jgi:hypothetical protein
MDRLGALLDLATEYPLPALVAILIIVSGTVHLAGIFIALLTLFVEHLTHQLVGFKKLLRRFQRALIGLLGILGLRAKRQPTRKQAQVPAATQRTAASVVRRIRLRFPQASKFTGRQRKTRPLLAELGSRVSPLSTAGRVSREASE